MISLNSLPSIKQVEEVLGPLFPLYLGTLTLFIENAISVAECRAKINHLLPTRKELHEKVIMEILELNTEIESPIEKISISKYKMETVRALGQVERDRLRNSFGNIPPRISKRTILPLSPKELSYSHCEELLDVNMLSDRILSIADKVGLKVGEGCPEFLHRAVKVLVSHLDVYA